MNGSRTRSDRNHAFSAPDMPQAKRSTDWLSMGCPFCNSEIGVKCISERGAEKHTPHIDRQRITTREYNTLPPKYSISAGKFLRLISTASGTTRHLFKNELVFCGKKINSRVKTKAGYVSNINCPDCLQLLEVKV